MNKGLMHSKMNIYFFKKMDDIKDIIECWFTSKDRNMLKEDRKRQKIKELSEEIQKLKDLNIKYSEYEKKAFNRAEYLHKQSITYKKMSKTKNKQRKKALENKAIRNFKDAKNEYKLSETYGNLASSYNKRINDLRCSYISSENINSIKNTTSFMIKSKINISKASKIIDVAIEHKEDEKDTKDEIKNLLDEFNTPEELDTNEEDEDKNITILDDIDSESFEEKEFEYPLILNNNKYISNKKYDDEYDDENEKELQYE